MKKKGKKGIGSGDQISSHEYYHPNDQTTAAGNSSNLGEPLLQPGMHHTPEKAIAVPRLPNTRKPNWKQPRNFLYFFLNSLFSQIDDFLRINSELSFRLRTLEKGPV